MDIVDELLQYAASKSPKNYIFLNHQALDVPAENDSADMICAFSLFTHLLHTETYLYLEGMYRVLKPGGHLVFSFLEFEMPAHWAVFDSTLEQQKNSNVPVLNTFIERNVIQCWANRLGFKIIELINGDVEKFAGKALGQSIAILEK